MLKNLIIKPTLKCNANCSFCEQRISHYKKNNPTYSLSLANWIKILEESASLGTNVVNISGGEPTLYQDLFSLITACKNKSFTVRLKTNAFLLNKAYVKELATVGLDLCTISIYSQNPTIHDRIKKIKGSHRAAIRAIKYLRNRGIKTSIQTVLTSHILKSFDKYLKWAGGLNIDTLYLSYLEGRSNFMRPSTEEILIFVSKIIPKCKEVLTEIFKKEPKLLEENLANLEKMFRFEKISFKEISQGIYNKGLNGCGRNYTMALILGNGEIHPCNAVEYFHKPIVGNLMVEGLCEAWHSSKWQKVKLSGPGWCRFCPMNRHTFIKFVDDDSIPSSYFPPEP